nr:transposase [Caldibacillus debilis]
MAYQNSTLSLEQMLLKFMSEQDPMLAMLQWLCEQMMEAEVTAKIQAQKSERTDTRTGYRSGYRLRRFDTRMGTMYLFVPKLRKGGYVPFFVSAFKRPMFAVCQCIVALNIAC